MPDLLFLRHAPTDWNEAGRMQGRADRDLSAAGLAEAGAWRLPAFAASWPCRSSPLVRARRTAEAMGLAPLADAAFIEMDWGRWEGRTLAELRAEGRAAFAAEEARGLDFRPPEGETPREVGRRAMEGLRGFESSSVIVTHKGVIRALLALACGWDMTGKAPVRLRPASAHLFRLDEDRLLTLVAPNIPLTDRSS